MSAGAGSYNGLAWGPGTPYMVVGAMEVRSMPSLRGRDLDLSERHGSASLADYAEPAQLVLTLGLRGDDHTHLEALSDAVRQATPPAAVASPLLYRDSTRMRWAKPRRRALPEDASALWRQGQAVIEFFCADPREYEAAARSQTTALPTGGAGGFGFPLAFPIGFGAGGVGGDLQLVNPGNVDAPLTLRINGPVTNPVVGVVGRTLTLQTTVAAGDFLLIDTEARTVLLNGTGSVRSAVVEGSTWPVAPPGASTLQYRASSAADPAATLQVTYRGTWL